MKHIITMYPIHDMVDSEVTPGPVSDELMRRFNEWLQKNREKVMSGEVKIVEIELP